MRLLSMSHNQLEELECWQLMYKMYEWVSRGVQPRNLSLLRWNLAHTVTAILLAMLQT